MIFKLWLCLKMAEKETKLDFFVELLGRNIGISLADQVVVLL